MYMNSGISYYDIMKDKITFPDYYDYCKNNFETILYDVPLKHNVKEVIDKLKENNEIIFITARNKDEYNDPYTYTKLFLERNNIPLEYISEGKLLTNEEYKKVLNFIEKEIVGKTFTSQSIFDASFNVSGNYNNHTFNIHNNVGFTNNEEGLYDKAKKIIETIKGER